LRPPDYFHFADLLLEDGAHNWYAYAIIVFFIWVPVIGIVTAIIRKIAGIKKANAMGTRWLLVAMGAELDIYSTVFCNAYQKFF